MIPGGVAENLLPWIVQISVVSAAGALLPRLFRIRHPKSQLAYYHALLALCFAIPVIQQWEHPLVWGLSSGSPMGLAVTKAPMTWSAWILVGLAAGGALKLGWLGIGLCQLRCYRKRSTPMFGIPGVIRSARALTQADARFYISKDVTGPATFGFIDPAVLLPKTFLDLESDAQHSIACHELMHVRRKDWLTTVLEELAAAAFWFHPAVWWLLAQARLSREQIVDAEVIRITPTAPYIKALLSMAVIDKERWPIPAAPFFTKDHLVHRMRSLLAAPQRSLARLCISYASMAGLLIATGWCVVVAFPLVGEAQVIRSSGPVRAPFFAFTFDRNRSMQNSGPREEFTIRVSPPKEPIEDVTYFVGPAFSPGVLWQGNLLSPPPPLPLPPQAGTMVFGVAGPGIAFVRRGERPISEAIARFWEAFPNPQQVEISRAGNGVVYRIFLQARRLENEASSIPFGWPLNAVWSERMGADESKPADGANRID